MKRLLLSTLFLGLLSSVVVLTLYLVRQSPAPLELEESVPTLQAEVSFAETPEPIRVLFAGDIMLDRHVRTNAERNGYSKILSELTPLLTSVDAVVANLEGPVTDFPSKSVGSEVGSSNNFLFTFEPESLQVLTENNISIVNLGNNHMLNFGEDGLEQTFENLATQDIQAFGYTGSDTNPSTLITTIRDIQFGFVNYNQFVTGGYERALTDIASLRSKVDVLVVHPHWGLEYEPLANSVIREQAHAFIDAGADLLIGAHPHVIQQKEVYQGKTVYYSLGNFIFDQYFEDAVREGMLVEVVFDPVTLDQQFIEYRTWLEKDGRTVFKSVAE